MTHPLRSNRPGAVGDDLRLSVDTASTRHTWSINILLVDDDAADISLISGALRRRDDVSSVHAFQDPERALEAVELGKLSPDLVLLDICMPRIDGFTVMAGLRRIPATIMTPVVMLTTSRLSRDVNDAKRGRADGYVVKPDTYGELQSRMDDVVKRTINGGWSRF